jgi:hypothetical protein
MWYICTLQYFSKENSQIEAHGAKVHIVPGSREDTAKAALNAVERGEGFYASHATIHFSIKELKPMPMKYMNS